MVVSMRSNMRPPAVACQPSVPALCQSVAAVWQIVWQKDLIVEAFWDTCGQTFTLEYDFAGIAQLVEHLICNKLL
jgi:hypothetical protein